MYNYQHAHHEETGPGLIRPLVIGLLVMVRFQKEFGGNIQQLLQQLEMNMEPSKLIFLVVSFLLAGAAMAHPGGLNTAGCHNEKKTGSYHCHGAQSASPQLNNLLSPQETPRQVRISPAPSTRGAATCFTGPRGGTYTLTSSGRKNYGGC